MFGYIGNTYFVVDINFRKCHVADWGKQTIRISLKVELLSKNDFLFFPSDFESMFA